MAGRFHIYKSHLLHTAGEVEQGEQLQSSSEHNEEGMACKQGVIYLAGLGRFCEDRNYVLSLDKNSIGRG